MALLTPLLWTPATPATVYVPRYPRRFTSADGTIVATFAPETLAWDSQQGRRSALQPVVGGDYAVDLIGSYPWARAEALENVSFTIVGTSIQDQNERVQSLRTALARIGTGKLWTSDGATERWAWAKSLSRPAAAIGNTSNFLQPVACAFVRTSDWFASAQQSQTVFSGATPTTFIITNSGDLPVKFMEWRIRANSVSGYTKPTLTNSTNGYAFTVNRSAASALDELRIDTERNVAERSVDDGVTYTDESANLQLGATQAAIMRLEVGQNTFVYSDLAAPNCSLELTYYQAFD